MIEPLSENGSRPRSFVQAVHNGKDNGFYESHGDVHLYDLMEDGFYTEIDENPERDASDVLVATAAWQVPLDRVNEVSQWLRRIQQLPRGWLTPWRAMEPSIDADLWLDQLVGDGSLAYLVVRLDNSYLLDVGLRMSLNAALDRFDALRTAIE